MRGGLPECLGFEDAVEFRLERGQAAREARFLAVEVGEGVRLHEALESKGFEGEFSEAGEQVCDGRVRAHADEFERDEFGFVRWNAAEARKAKNSCSFSVGRSGERAVRPWVSELREEMALPAAVRGPVAAAVGAELVMV